LLIYKIVKKTGSQDMKYSHFVICLVAFTTATTTFTETITEQPVEKEDKELLLIFSSLVSCFANILKDPNNPRNLAINLTGIATGVLNMLLNTMSCKFHPYLIKEITKIKTLTTQRFLKNFDYNG
jgi:hypothetical protein